MQWLDISDKSLAPDEMTATVVAMAHRCDAHTLWACLSGFDGYLRTDDPASEGLMVPVLVEIDPAATKDERLHLRALLRPPGAYQTGLGGDNFWSASMRSQDLGQLIVQPRVLRWRIGLAVAQDTDPRQVDASVPLINKQLPVVVGVIDHGIAMAHAAFRYPHGGPKSRILALWDQDPDRLLQNDEGHWTPVRGLGYGGEITAPTLEALIGASQDDQEVYRHLQYEPSQGRVSHGTHVLDLAAGLPNPLTPPHLRGDPAAFWAWSGRASNTNIVAVQLPYKPAKDTSGSALCVHVLDALQYIVRRAPVGRKVVVNLSDGAYGGPHDGNSLLERAIDEFLYSNSPRVELVLAAGNAHEGLAHARVTALQKGQKQRLRWRVLPDDPTLSFVEVWADRALAAADLTLVLTPPSGASPVTVPLGSSKVLVRADMEIVGAVISVLDSPNGPGRSMYLVVLTPTRRRTSRRPEAPHGVWGLEIANAAAAAPVDVDAWIERDNPALNDRGPRRQSYFEDDRCVPLNVDGQRTLGSLAGSKRPVVVGGHYGRNTAFSGCDPLRSTDIARYSSRGPGRRGAVKGPDLTAPSDASPVAHGLHGAANHSGAAFRMDGTSVAAPIVSRRVANLLIKDPSLPVKDRLVPAPKSDPDYKGERGRITPGEEPLPDQAI